MPKPLIHLFELHNSTPLPPNELLKHSALVTTKALEEIGKLSLNRDELKILDGVTLSKHTPAVSIEAMQNAKVKLQQLGKDERERLAVLEKLYAETDEMRGKYMHARNEAKGIKTDDIPTDEITVRQIALLQNKKENEDNFKRKVTELETKLENSVEHRKQVPVAPTI